MRNYNELCKSIARKFNVVEDNAGGLTLVIFDKNDEIEFITTNFEYAPGSLISALEKLSYGDDISYWESNLIDDDFECSFVKNPKCFESWLPDDFHRIGWDIIADNDGIYPESMGTAGQIEFGIRRE